MVARTLTQHAVPTTFGFRVAAWLTAVLDADEDLAAWRSRDQLGGAAGTRAAMVELGASRADRGSPPVAHDPRAGHPARRRARRLHRRLRPDRQRRAHPVAPRDRRALARARRRLLDDAQQGQPGAVGAGPPRRAHDPPARRDPAPGRRHQVDDRADGGWHAEWATLRDLVRRTLVAASQTTDLLDGLRVHADRMAATLAAAGDDVLAEQRTMAELAGRDPAATYLGTIGPTIDAVLARARNLEEPA